MKFVNSKEEIEYKERLRAFQQVINPKPSKEERAKMKEAYLKAQRTSSVVIKEA